MNPTIMPEPNYRIKCIPRSHPELKDFFLYRTKKDLYSYIFWKTLDRSWSPIRTYKCHRLESAGR